MNKRNNEMSRQVVLKREILSTQEIKPGNRRESTGTQYLMMVHLGLSLGGSFGNAAENVIPVVYPSWTVSWLAQSISESPVVTRQRQCRNAKLRCD
ncbi:hypothetical protein [Escherichia coli]|uniref:hypothetical protein n=1 Tax=Escherichia coli TaxID=562 RepID=UPI002FCCC63D